MTGPVLNGAAAPRERSPSSAREALLGIAIGEVQLLLERVTEQERLLRSSAAESAASAESVRTATAEYRAQIDTSVERLREAFRAMLGESAAEVGRAAAERQAEFLERAARQAIRASITTESTRRSKRDWLLLVAAGALVGAVIGASVAILTARVL